MNLTTIVEDIFTTLIEKKYGEDNIDKFSVIKRIAKIDKMFFTFIFSFHPPLVLELEHHEYIQLKFYFVEER